MMGNKQGKSDTLSERKTDKVSIQQPRNRIPIETDNLFWDNHLHEPTNHFICRNIPQYTDMCQWELFHYYQQLGIIPYLCIDEFVTEFIRKHFEVAILQLNMAISAREHQKISKRPTFSNIPEDLIDVYLDFPLINDICNNIKKNTKMSDIDVVGIYGFETYQLIKHILYNNRDVTLELVEPNIDNTIKETIKDTIKVFEVIYNDDLGIEGNLYYHGSGYHNWYSITYKGLQVPGQSEGLDVINGAVHGKKIYISPYAETSHYYSRKAPFNRTYILGLVQTNTFTKNRDNIYTIDAKDRVRLRYLIVYTNPSIANIETIKKSLPYNISTKVPDNSLFEIEQPQTIEEQKPKIIDKLPPVENLQSVSSKTIRRINKQLRKMSKVTHINEYPISLEFDEDNIQLWHLLIKTKKWDDMVWEIRFSDNYPKTPPFVRILKPYFKYLTGHITLGGAICNPLLTSKSWDPNISMESLFFALIIGMEEGGAITIKEHETDHKYTLKGAQAGYSRYIKNHGWTGQYTKEEKIEGVKSTKFVIPDDLNDINMNFISNV